jgi:Zn-dependent protease
MDVSLETIVLWAVPVVLAITLHEAAHGYVAKLFGDRTAEMLGRITLNPLKHIDPVGTILVPGVLLALAWINKAPPFVFGWAKPVPVNFGNLRNPRRDMIWGEARTAHAAWGLPSVKSSETWAGTACSTMGWSGKSAVTRAMATSAAAKSPTRE